MIFNSVTYLLFLPIVVILYWFLPKYPRRLMLLISSLVFYAFWRWEFTLLLIIAAIIDYYCSIEIEKRIEQKERKQFLIFSLFINFGLLFYFKYLTFFANSFVWALNIFGVVVQIPHLDIILPLGISFYTFETTSYTVDVYRKHIKAEKDFLTYATFLVYFPHLIAGPVLRAADILHQLEIKKKFDWQYLSKGFSRVLEGLFLKVVLADNISPWVDAAFGQSIPTLGVIDVFTMAFMFGFQIYFDFSAYSHIAIGSAQMMGITFPENFNFPYAATSFKDFWKRWHISLSGWIRDYLYLPILGVKVSNNTSIGIGESLTQDDNKPKRNKNLTLFLTWGIMGLWHGANWTFIFWGLYHATLIFLERLIQPLFKGKINIKLASFLGWCITLPLVMLSWIPFRAQSMTDVFSLFAKFLYPKSYLVLSLNENTYLIAALVMFLVIAAHYLTIFFEKQLFDNIVFRIGLGILKYTTIILLVFTFLRPISQFIYFQF